MASIVVRMIGYQKGLKVGFKLVMRVVVVTLDHRFLDGAAHALDLDLGPRMFGLGKTRLNAMVVAAQVEPIPDIARCGTMAIPGLSAQLCSVASQRGVDDV